jgi:MFS transporter, ACS family, D-galactonate transporter
MLSRQRKWVVVGLLSLGMVIAYIDRANLSVVLALKEFQQTFHPSDMERGLLNSAFFWSYALLQIPAGWIVDRYGVKFPYAIGFLFWTIFSALTGMVQSTSQLVALRFLLGCGESIVGPASLRWIRFNCKEQERGLAVGIYLAGAKIGPAIGVPVTAMLVTAFGWRVMFLTAGGAGFLWLIAWLLLVKNDDRQLETTANAAVSAPPVPFARLMVSPVMWGILLGTFCYSYFLFFCVTWLPAYFVEYRHLSLTSMGLYTMFSFGGMAVVATSAGWAADQMIRRGRDAVKVRKGFIICGLVVGSTELLGGLTDSRSIALFFAIFSLAGLGLATANLWALSQTMIPGAAIGRISGVQNCASNLSGIVAPILSGWLKQITGSYTAPMQAIWIFLVVGIFSYAVLVRPRYLPPAISP